jgi:signal peptidase I
MICLVPDQYKNKPNDQLLNSSQDQEQSSSSMNASEADTLSEDYSKTTFVRDALIVIVVGLSIAFLVQNFLVKPYLIPSESMTPTLEIGQRILVDRTAYLRQDPQVGDVVVFHPPKDIEGFSPCAAAFTRKDQACSKEKSEPDSIAYIKRIVAQAGDSLTIKDGLPVVNGQIIRPQGYKIIPCSIGGQGCNYSDPITVPKDHYFVMGDNRGGSLDSRFWGPLPREWLIGKAFTSYWPPSRISGL